MEKMVILIHTHFYWETRNCKGSHTISASACVSGWKEEKCDVWCLKNQKENKIGMVITMRLIFLGWPYPVTFVLCSLGHQTWHFASLSSETRAVTTRVSRSKWVQSTELNIVMRSIYEIIHIWTAVVDDEVKNEHRTVMIHLHFHLQPQFKYELFHIYFTSFHSSWEIWTQ